MKKILLVVVVVLFGIGAFAQHENIFDAGLKLGFGSSSLKLGIGELENDGFNDMSIQGFQYGGFARLNINKCFIQSELNVNIKRGEMSNTVGTGLFDFNTLEIPVLFGYKLMEHRNSNLRVNVGPVFTSVSSVIISNDEVFDIAESDFRDNYAGIQFGIGVDVTLITIDVRYERNLNLLNSSASNDIKNQVVTVAVGVKLF